VTGTDFLEMFQKNRCLSPVFGDRRRRMFPEKQGPSPFLQQHFASKMVHSAYAFSLPA
jgi:hypothetical protein